MMTRRKPIYCDHHDDGSRSLYTLRCARTGESQEVVVCRRHAELLPIIDDDLVTAEPVDSGLLCDMRETAVISD